LHKWGREEAHTKFYSENIKEKDRLGDLGIDVRIILRRILREQGVRVWTIFI